MKQTAWLLAAAVLMAGCGSTVQARDRTVLGAANDQGGQQVLSGGGFPDGHSGSPSAAPTNTATVPVSGSVGPLVGGAAVPDPTATVHTGTTRITTPITLGFMSTKVSNAQSAGLNVGQTFSDKQLYAALIKEYNASGGLAGRKIIPLYGETDTASNDWNTQFQAACQALAQDNHVQAVLGYVFVFLDSFEQCLASHRIPHLYGGYQPGDVQAQRDFPNIVSVTHPTVNLVNETVLAGAMATGRLTTSSKLGIVYDGCAHGDRAFRNSTEPYLKQHGIHYEAVYMDCAGGAGDVSSAAAAVKSAQLQFATHGVDVVLCTNGIELLLFMENAESQAYRPSYIAPGGGAALEVQQAVPKAQMKNLHGYGWMPAIDVGANHQPYPHTAEEVACLTKLKHQGLTPAQYNDFMLAYVTCDSLDLYAKALALTAGRSDASELQRAVLQVMKTFHGAATYDGAFAVSNVERGGPARYREYGWTDGCSCFTYRGPVRPIPTP